MEWKPDKTKHAVVSFGLTVIAWCLTWNIPLSMVLALLVGIGKETWDQLSASGSGWDNEDILADIIGIAAGAALISIILEVGVGIWICN